MKVLLMAVGRTQSPLMRQGIDLYLDRLRHYLPVEVKIIDDVKASRSLTLDAQNPPMPTP